MEKEKPNADSTLRSTEMWAGTLSDGMTFFHFYPHPKLITSVCGCPKSFHVRVTEEPDPTPESYWAWWCNKDNKFVHVYPRRLHVDICFPRGIAGEEARDTGKALPVTIERIDH